MTHDQTSRVITLGVMVIGTIALITIEGLATTISAILFIGVLVSLSSISA